MQNKKKILFVNDEMTMGGVARILNTLLKMIDKSKYDIDLLVLHKRGELLNEIPEGVRVLSGTPFFDTIDLPLSSCRGKDLLHKLRLLFYMKTGLIASKIRSERKKILSDTYDVEFSAKEGFCTIFTAYGDSRRKLNWVQVDYEQSNYSRHHMALVTKALTRIDMNIACSETVKTSYKKLFNVDRICVIHNPINEERIRDLASQPDPYPNSTEKIKLITVARFHPQKGLDRLIDAFAEVKDRYDLTIIGDGELNNSLHEQAKRKGVDERIHWLGMQENPYPMIRNSDLFIMSSLYEGYPTITIETLLSGTPILTTDVAGVGEQIVQPETGWIVENSTEGMIKKLEELSSEKTLLADCKSRLKDYHYENDRILSQLENLF